MLSEPAELRDLVRDAVAARDPIDDVERACIADFLDHFDALAHPFDPGERSCARHRIGDRGRPARRGAARHKRLGFWLQPGGHVDAGESPWDAALREAREETGLDVRFAGGGEPRLVHVDVHPGGRGHTHLDLRYLVDGGDADPAPPEDESQEIGWFDWDAAIERAGDERLKSALRSLRPETCRFSTLDQILSMCILGIYEQYVRDCSRSSNPARGTATS